MTPPADEPAVVAFAVVVLASLAFRAVAAFPKRHRYTSTACTHGHHAKCRRTCKFCDARCTCECHRLATLPEVGKSAA